MRLRINRSDFIRAEHGFNIRIYHFSLGQVSFNFAEKQVIRAVFQFCRGEAIVEYRNIHNALTVADFSGINGDTAFFGSEFINSRNASSLYTGNLADFGFVDFFNVAPILVSSRVKVNQIAESENAKARKSSRALFADTFYILDFHITIVH